MLTCGEFQCITFETWLCFVRMAMKVWSYLYTAYITRILHGKDLSLKLIGATQLKYFQDGATIGATTAYFKIRPCTENRQSRIRWCWDSYHMFSKHPETIFIRQGIMFRKFFIQVKESKIVFFEWQSSKIFESIARKNPLKSPLILFCAFSDHCYRS